VTRPDHIVLLMLENKDYASINGSAEAPYLNSLARQGATFTHSFAITHPSQPNYVAIISGSTQGVTSDACPQQFRGKENLPHQLLAAGLGFVGYSESMPAAGFTGCSAAGLYARKHNGWVDFDNVPDTSNQPFSAFPTDFSTLPTLAYVVPNLCNDMHDCPISTGDRWTRDHLDAYVQWAKTHNSVLIVTLDEDGGARDNRIFTVVVGEHVKVGAFDERIDHYAILRTIEAAYGLSALGSAAQRTPITDIWR
jgi:acid phosphatase